jgi:hypothetical protein
MPEADTVIEVPMEIFEILSDSLTQTGMGQWWTARNRMLDNRTPATCWEHEANRTRVLAAARAWSFDDYGFYV